MDLISSLTAGLAGVKSPDSLSPDCGTGNCRFQATSNVTYSSIGFSSECVDISSLIRQTGQLSWGADDAEFSPKVTNYSIPGRNPLVLSYNLDDFKGISHTDARWNTVLATTSDWYGAIDISNVSSTQRQRDIMDVSFDSVSFLMTTVNPCQSPQDYGDYLGPRAPQMPPFKTSSCPQLSLPRINTLPGFFSVVAAQCFIYTSIQHYSGSIVNGTFEEDRVGDPVPLRTLPVQASNRLPHDVFPSGIWHWGISDPCIVDGVIYTNANSNLSSVPGGLVTISNVTAPKRCLYGLDRYWQQHLESIGGVPISSLIIGSSTRSSICQQSNNYTVMICGDAWWLSDLYNGGSATIGSINAFLDAGLKSLTNQLRTHGTDWDNNTLVATGTVMETTVCTEFYWVWLVYPLVILAGTLGLFLATLLSSSGRFGYVQETVWKSSVLPLLFYGLEARHQRDGPRLSTTKELEALAKKLEVDFSAKAGKWRLRATEKGDDEERLRGRSILGEMRHRRA